METLKYTIIKTKEQYTDYCNRLEELILMDTKTVQDEIELLTLLIEKWDNENNTFAESDPIEILKLLMTEHGLKATDLSKILNLSKGTVSKILNYHKGLSKETIRSLSEYFKLSQEAFNRPYRLKNPINKTFKDASLMNTPKNVQL